MLLWLVWNDPPSRSPHRSVTASSLLLTDLQHIGVDKEADVGEVLLLEDSWDVIVHLCYREAEKHRKQRVTHKLTQRLLRPHLNQGLIYSSGFSVMHHRHSLQAGCI